MNRQTALSLVLLSGFLGLFVGGLVAWILNPEPMTPQRWAQFVTSEYARPRRVATDFAFKVGLGAIAGATVFGVIAAFFFSPRRGLQPSRPRP